MLIASILFKVENKIVEKILSEIFGKIPYLIIIFSTYCNYIFVQFFILVWLFLSDGSVLLTHALLLNITTILLYMCVFILFAQNIRTNCIL